MTDFVELGDLRRHCVRRVARQVQQLRRGNVHRPSVQARRQLAILGNAQIADGGQLRAASRAQHRLALSILNFVASHRFVRVAVKERINTRGMRDDFGAHVGRAAFLNAHMPHGNDVRCAFRARRIHRGLHRRVELIARFILHEAVDEVVEAQRHVVGIIEMNQRGDVFRQLLLIQFGKADKRFRLFEFFHMIQGEPDMKEVRVEGGNQIAAGFGQFPAPELMNLIGFRCVLKRRRQPDAFSEDVFRKRDRDFSLHGVFDLSEELEVAAVVENEETFFAGVFLAFYGIGAGQVRTESCSASDHLPEFGF